MLDPILSFLVLVLKVVYLYGLALFRAVAPANLIGKKSVRGKKVLITGSGSGIGRQLAVEFGKAGAYLVLWDVNQKGNEETKQILKSQGVDRVETYTVDLSNNEDIDKVADLVRRDVGKIDILINNAGVASGKMLQKCTKKTIDLAFDVNIKSHFYTLKNFLPKMLDDDSGHIVTIASVAGKMTGAGLPDYYSTKHAAVGFHDSISAEIAASGKFGVKTTLVCPYYIHTPMFDTSGAVTRFPWIFPLLEVDYVARKILEAVQIEQEFLVMPKSFYFVIATLGLMPMKVQQVVGEYLGLIQSNSRFNPGS